MKSATNKLVKMFEDLFAGKYEPYKFSVEFPEYCFSNYDELEKEHRGLGEYLDEEVPDICDEGEPGFDATLMIAKLKAVYKKVLQIIA